MNIVEEYLAKNSNNVFEAAANLARDLMRGDPATLKLGYTMGNALISVTEMFSLGDRGWAVVVDILNKQTPLVIIGVGGGLIQWTVNKPGFGEPRVFELDYDREGEPPEETAFFADRIEEALEALIGFNDPADAGVAANMRWSIAEYRAMAKKGERPGRYR